MKLPPAAYLAIAIVAGLLLIAGLVTAVAGIRNSSKFFAIAPARRIDTRLGRRGARAFCLMVGGMLSLLGATLLTVSVFNLIPARKLRSIDPFPARTSAFKEQESDPPVGSPRDKTSDPPQSLSTD